MPPRSESHAVQAVVSQIDALTDRDEVSVRDIVATFGSTAFLPILLVPALLVISPLSGIPFFSSLCGVIIALIAAQLLIGRSRIWLPEMVLNRVVTGPRLHNGASRVQGFAARVDGLSRDRLRGLVGPGRDWIVFTACLICGAVMPVMEMVPFSSSLLGVAVVLHTVGVLARDGLFVVFGFAVMGAAISIPLGVLFGLASL